MNLPKLFISALKTTWIRWFCFDTYKWIKIIGNHINMDNMDILHIYMRNKKGTNDVYKVLNCNKETPAGKIAWNKKEWKKITNCHLK